MSVYPITDQSNLTRYIFSRRQIKSNNVIHLAAFLPRDGQTSVCNITDLQDNDIWDIGTKDVGELRGQLPRGRGDIIAGLVLSINLKPDPDAGLRGRHVNIKGWPEDKDLIREKAERLASMATLHLAP